MGAKDVCQYEAVTSWKLLKSAASLICLKIAVGTTNVSPVFLCTHPNFSIPIPLYNQNVLHWYLVYGSLDLLEEVVDLPVSMLDGEI